MLRLGEGKRDAAWQDLCACHRLARFVGRGATLIESLVAIAIDIIASRADLAFMEDSGVGGRQLEKCLRELESLPPLPSVADKVELGERFTFLDNVTWLDQFGVSYLETLARGEAPDKHRERDRVLEGIDWNPALRNINKLYDRLAAALRENDRAMRQKKLQDIENDLEELKKKGPGQWSQIEIFLAGDSAAGVRGKYIGDVLMALMVPAVSKVERAADLARQVEANLHVAFALAWYRREHGHYPNELAVLAPNYLKKIPHDLFSGTPLIYRPKKDGYLFYSVGQNGKDEGGRWFDDTPPGDDLAVRMPLPEPRRK
jgi:type II secretory pathway pseudopilin PulG